MKGGGDWGEWECERLTPLHVDKACKTCRGSDFVQTSPRFAFGVPSRKPPFKLVLLTVCIGQCIACHEETAMVNLPKDEDEWTRLPQYGGKAMDA